MRFCVHLWRNAWYLSERQTYGTEVVKNNKTHFIPTTLFSKGMTVPEFLRHAYISEPIPFWAIAPRGRWLCFRRFGRTCCLHLQGRSRVRMQSGYTGPGLGNYLRILSTVLYKLHSVNWLAIVYTIEIRIQAEVSFSSRPFRIRR